LRVDKPGVDPLAEALRAGRGAVIVTGHFGNWDVGAKMLNGFDRPINNVIPHETNRTTRENMRTARSQAGVRVIYSDSSVFSSLNMIHALRQNEIVALQLDRPGATERTRLLPFFGAPAPFPTGPFVLARLAGAPLVPVFVPRLGRRHYAIRIGTPLQVTREARDPQLLEPIMAAAVAELEAVVREFPTQWFQFAPFWSAAAEARAPVAETVAGDVAGEAGERTALDRGRR
jgi:KDO2-lipid IV(A) lauroyltransferase